MKSGKVIKVNAKGQVVIPKEYRDALGITSAVPLHVVPHGRSLLLYPVVEMPDPDTNQTVSDEEYKQILNETQGDWAESEDWEGHDKREATQRKLELKATQEGKKEW